MSWQDRIVSGIEVLQLAQKENCILITFDKDFGELAFRYGLPAQKPFIVR
jgi:predicted nuclease of predicted toxin-antitoxin system